MLSMISRFLPSALAGLVSVAIGLALPGAAPAASTLVPVEHFANSPRMRLLQASPDGKLLAAIVTLNDRKNIAVMSVGGGEARVVTSFEQFDVASFRWIGPNRLVLSLTSAYSGLANERGGGLYAVDADGSNGRELAPTLLRCMNSLDFACRQIRFHSIVPGSESEILVVAHERSRESADLVRLDTRTGRKSMLSFKNPGKVRDWVVDAQLVPRAAMSFDSEQLQRIFWFRESEDAPWRVVGRYGEFEPSMRPLAFGPDGTLYVASNLESGDKNAIYMFDPKTSRPGEQLAASPQFDVDVGEDPLSPNARSGPLIFDPQSGRLIGLAVDGDRPEVIWFDERWSRMQKTVDASLSPGSVNTVQPVNDQLSLVWSRSGSDPGIYYLYDGDKRQLAELFRPREWIRPEQMGKVSVLRYKARDGLEIPAYLTVPANRPAKNLPLVVWVHGGPWARDDYGWDADAQFLASRGYAVLQPNYRGSTGFGLKHLTAGFKQLGQAMQNDLTDGVLHLAAQGTVDRQRVCIGGASYGGYATVMALVREPALFRCGINVVGVTDLVWWLELGYTDFNRIDSAGAAAWLTRTVGDPANDRAMMEANSPRLLAQGIKAPLLIVHGAQDVRVPIKHAQALRDALEANGQKPDWLVFPEEGHGFGRFANRVTYYQRIEAFLARHLPP